MHITLIELQIKLFPPLVELLDEIGYREYPTDTECIRFLRLFATKWACRFGSRECLESAKLKLEEYLQDPGYDD